MPHITVEYSGNLVAEIALDDLLDKLHAAALATGVFPIGGTRTRALRFDDFRVADSHPDNAFVHVGLRIGHGRDLPTRQRAGERLFAVVCEHLAPISARRPLAISMEIQEIDPELSFKHNNLHDIVAARRAAPVRAGAA